MSGDNPCALAYLYLAEIEDKIRNVDGPPKDTHKQKPRRLYLCIEMPLWDRLEINKQIEPWRVSSFAA